ncbi:hypothetical protein CDL15_Pgr024154 [Punica granatum]|uniref:Uncharacterized protein n=1 Tax=Punica granatum TaxID=22663 RepID=A0A218XXN9_PUNGR|nr:hypothetical protein CDL15_Pgr024154 [Punica granatum]PKI40393.1 hypothetical protein CRG98_039239 [Punica granatum]
MGGGAKECRIDIVALQCAGGTVALGYPIDAKPPPPPPIHIPKYDPLAAVPVAVTTARVGAGILVTR